MIPCAWNRASAVCRSDASWISRGDTSRRKSGDKGPTRAYMCNNKIAQQFYRLKIRSKRIGMENASAIWLSVSYNGTWIYILLMIVGKWWFVCDIYRLGIILLQSFTHIYSLIHWLSASINHSDMNREQTRVISVRASERCECGESKKWSSSLFGVLSLWFEVLYTDKGYKFLGEIINTNFNALNRCLVIHKTIVGQVGIV